MQEGYTYTESILPHLIVSISKERLSTYMRIANSTNPETALKLYTKNTKLSESFYSPIQGLEITLRNRIYIVLAKYYGDDWLISGQFKLEYIQRRQVENIVQLNSLITIPKLIAELNFGFWTGLLGRHYEETWRSHLRFIFHSSNPVLTRKVMHNKIDNIRKLRNRIAHHEPIIERNWHEDYKSIIDIISLLCPSTSNWVAAHSTF